MLKRLLILTATVSVSVILTFTGVGCEDDDDSSTGVINNPPEIRNLIANPATFDSSYRYREAHLSCLATDPDGDSLSYFWECPHGNFIDTNIGQAVTWVAPNIPNEYFVTVNVSDGIDITLDSVAVTIVPG